MKKTLTTIIALLLVLSLVFAFVACNGGSENGSTTTDNNQSQTPSGGNGGTEPGTTKTATAADLQAAATYESYLQAYLLNNSDVTIDKLSALWATAKENTEAYSLISKVSAKAVSGGFEFTVVYKDKSTSTFTVTTPAADNGEYAGTAFNVATAVDFDAAFVALYNAAMKTIKTAVENGGTFTENGFGFAGEAWFQFNYGDLTDKLMDYALRVKGNIGVDAKDTAVALEVIDGSKVIGGLYYQGAQDKADCKLALKVVTDEDTFTYYIDNADINALVQSIIPKDIQEAVALAEDDATPFYEKEISSFAEILGDSGIGDMIPAIVSAVLGEGSVGYTAVTGGKKYQVKIDVETLLLTLKDTFGDLLSVIDFSEFPEPLNQLNLNTFQGVGGALVLTAVVTDAGTLGEVEISYNCAKQDFRFNEADAEAKVYGPVNVAFGIKDFSLAEQTNVVPDLSNYTYFSPLNAKVTGEFTISGEDYDVEIISECNPFVIDQAKASVIITKEGNKFLDFYFAMVDMDCEIVVVDGDTVYRSMASELNFEAPFDYLGVSFNENKNIFTPIMNYVAELMEMFGFGEDEEEEPAQDQLAPADEEGGIGLDQIMGLVGVFGDVKDLVTETWNGTVYTYTTNPVSFQGSVNYEQYNQILNLIMPNLEGLLPEEVTSFRFENTAATVFVAYNTEDYKDIAIAKVVYDGVTYTAILDMTEFDLTTGHGVLVGSFTIAGETTTIYKGVLDNSKWDESQEATFVYTVQEGDAQPVTYIDYSMNAESITLKLTTDETTHTYVFSSSEKLGLDLYTAVLDGVEVTVGGGDGFFRYENVGKTSFNIPKVEMGGNLMYEFPNSEAWIYANIKLDSWGEKVTAKTAPQAADTDGDVNDYLMKLAEDFFEIFAVPAE